MTFVDMTLYVLAIIGSVCVGWIVWATIRARAWVWLFAFAAAISALYYGLS